MNKENPLLVDTGSGLTVSYKNIHLYSSREPVRQVKETIDLLTLLPETLVLVESIGLGHGLAFLAEKLPRDSHILCLERDPVLFETGLRHVDPAVKNHPDITLLCTDSPQKACEVLSRFPAEKFRRVIAVRLCAGFRLSPGFYDAAESLLRESIKTVWQNRMTLIHLGRLFVKNVIENMSLLPRLSDAGRLGTDKPVLVIGAGPSLEKSLPLIRELRGKVLLLAVDTAYPVLADSGIFPDIILALESQFINLLDFLAPRKTGIPLIADLSSSPQVIRHFLDSTGSEVYAISSLFHPVSLFQRLKAGRMLPCVVPPLGSVGVTAVWLALKLTGNDVLVTGLDFSYSFMKNHSSGSPHHIAALSRVRRLCPAGEFEYDQFLKRPRITCRDKMNMPLVTDMVLQGYAENVRALASSSGRLVEISPAGLDLGGRKLYETTGIPGAEITGAASAAERSGESGFEKPSSARVLSFFKNEMLYIEQAEKILESRIRNASSDCEKLSAEEMEVLGRIDYAWFHLPHRLVPPDFNKSSLAAILLHCGYFRKRIERSLACISR